MSRPGSVSVPFDPEAAGRFDDHSTTFSAGTGGLDASRVEVSAAAAERISRI